MTYLRVSCLPKHRLLGTEPGRSRLPELRCRQLFHFSTRPHHRSARPAKPGEDVAHTHTCM
jgi:hypothetical protein